jgi:hypothetical protein
MTTSKGGRPKKLKDGCEWVTTSISLSTEERAEFDRLRGDRCMRDFINLLMQAYKLRRKDYALRAFKARNKHHTKAIKHDGNW